VEQWLAAGRIPLLADLRSIPQCQLYSFTVESDFCYIIVEYGWISEPKATKEPRRHLSSEAVERPSVEAGDGRELHSLGCY
jgi:hypothetical protein